MFCSKLRRIVSIRRNSNLLLGNGLFVLFLFLDLIHSEYAQLYQPAVAFALKELQPNMAKWDEEEIFPLETFKKMGMLGYGAMYCKSSNGGSDLNRLESSVILEGLSTGCVSTVAFLSIHK